MRAQCALQVFAGPLPTYLTSVLTLYRRGNLGYYRPSGTSRSCRIWCGDSQVKGVPARFGLEPREQQARGPAMDQRIVCEPARPVARALAYGLVTALVCAWVGSGALAQNPPAPGQPKAKTPATKGPAQKGPPAPPAATEPQQGEPQLVFSPWTKFCLKGQEANAKQVCFT